MRVSVIIPVYNAEQYVRQAVESALMQPETEEVILVEDASPDNALAICEELAQTQERVFLYRHPNGENRGASASRNLGILKSTCPFIAFLDADDFYLPNRFTHAKTLFEQHTDVDGVYECIGSHIESEEAKNRWETIGRLTKFTTMTHAISPEELFVTLLNLRHGIFHGNGLVVKRDVFNRTGLFDEPLRLHQDTIMWAKMASMCRLMAGDLVTPVAIRRMHEENRITAPRPPADVYRARLLAYETLWLWAKKHLPTDKEQIAFRNYLKYVGFWGKDELPAWRRGIRSYLLLLRVLTKHPSFLVRWAYWTHLFNLFPQGIKKLLQQKG